MTNSNGSVADEAALSALQPVHRIERITLENGIVLALKPVPPVMLRSASAHLVMPKVPVVNIPEKGRDEENPNDPDYLRARAQWFEDVSEAGLTVALVLGTEIVLPLPDGICGPESEDWINDLRVAQELVGGPALAIRTEGKGRYLDWLRMYAIPTNTDLFRLTRILTAGVSLTEDEVQRAAASFRSVLAGPADIGSPPAVTPAVGDHDRQPAPGAAA